MSLFTLVHTEAVTVATDQLVFSAEETGALQHIIEQAEAVSGIHAGWATKLADAEEQGYNSGHEKGHAAGVKLANEQVATRLLELAEQAAIEREQVRLSAAQMALDIVRSIAKGVGNESLLPALARSAAADLLPNQQAVLHLHPDELAGVERQLQAWSDAGDAVAAITGVVADDSLAPGGCILETPSGQVVADLETRLRVIESRLCGGGHGGL